MDAAFHLNRGLVVLILRKQVTNYSPAEDEDFYKMDGDVGVSRTSSLRRICGR